MNKEQDPLHNHHEALKAENAFLKLKLGLEHGMQMSETSELPPDVENQWLKSVYAFEQQYKDAGRTTVYDYVGKPAFKKWDTLSNEEIATELDRIELIMATHNLELDCICNYDKATIYKFITEELFQEEMDDMQIPGMTYHFIYEEFHPNHDHDLRSDAEHFINALFTRSWDPAFDVYKLTKETRFAGKAYDHAAISSIISTFQEAHASFSLESFDIREVAINPDGTEANVRAYLEWSGKVRQGENVFHQGACTFHFVMSQEVWSMDAFDVPGFS